jgi:glutathione-regulated potassium-efflux system ancillary protein KefG
MTPRVRTEDLIDAEGVAELLGLSHRNSVNTYLRRYSDMPRPVVDLGRGRPRLWLRPDIEKWLRNRHIRRTRQTG